jgi:hypothetical protein
MPEQGLAIVKNKALQKEERRKYSFFFPKMKNYQIVSVTLYHYIKRLDNGK